MSKFFVYIFSNYVCRFFSIIFGKNYSLHLPITEKFIFKDFFLISHFLTC